MSKQSIEPYVVEKRHELIWALAKQGYNIRHIAYIFGLSTSMAHNIIQKMPANYESPWKKS